MLRVCYVNLFLSDHPERDERLNCCLNKLCVRGQEQGCSALVTSFAVFVCAVYCVLVQHLYCQQFSLMQFVQHQCCHHCFVKENLVIFFPSCQILLLIKHQVSKKLQIWHGVCNSTVPFLSCSYELTVTLLISDWMIFYRL